MAPCWSITTIASGTVSRMERSSADWPAVVPVPGVDSSPSLGLSIGTMHTMPGRPGESPTGEVGYSERLMHGAGDEIEQPVVG